MIQKGEIIVAYNCIVMAYKITGMLRREIMYVVSELMFGYAIIDR